MRVKWVPIPTPPRPVPAIPPVPPIPPALPIPPVPPIPSVPPIPPIPPIPANSIVPAAPVPLENGFCSFILEIPRLIIALNPSISEEICFFRRLLLLIPFSLSLLKSVDEVIFGIGGI
ncbi:Uncharacterized protein CTYZ_00001504 [Cryptosporidium tyzzeri]|nr:Uncharacterized protein CTYZ_00001504 [Cryptosporidium tyzzeri]